MVVNVHVRLLHQKNTVFRFQNLALQNHKSIEHVAEYEYENTDDGVGNSFFGFICFFFITTSCEYEKTSIHNHDDCYEGNKAIEEDENLRKDTKDACSIKNSISTVCSDTKYFFTSTVSTTIGDSDGRLCEYHDDKSENGSDKYPFSFIKSLLITTGCDDSIKGIDSHHKETCRSNKTQKVQNWIYYIDSHIIDGLSVETFFAQDSCLKLSYNCIGYWYHKESCNTPYKGIHPFSEVFFTIIGDEEAYDRDEYKNSSNDKYNNSEVFEDLNKNITNTGSYVTSSISLMKHSWIIHVIESLEFCLSYGRNTQDDAHSEQKYFEKTIKIIHRFMLEELERQG